VASTTAMTMPPRAIWSVKRIPPAMKPAFSRIQSVSYSDK
jgi:hypothetical protein